MAETRLTEHVRPDAEYVWVYHDPEGSNVPHSLCGGGVYSLAILELAQALLAERERVAKLRAELEDIAEMRLYGGDTLWTKAAKAALEEDGEGLQDG